MKARMLLISAAAALVLLPSAGQGAERAKAKVECTPAGEELVYDCMIMLMGRKSGKPLADAKIVVGAEMPSMPMAHHVKPVTATAMDKPGMYHARVHLQMAGEWALTMDVSGPTRDKLVHTQSFGTHEGEMKMKHEGEMKMKQDGEMKMKQKDE